VLQSFQRTRNAAYAAAVALFVLLAGSVALTQSLGRDDFVRALHGPGALAFTFPLFLLFGAGAVVLGGFALLRRRELGLLASAISMLPGAVAAAGVAVLLLLSLS
jgi:hypothetical protein